MLHTIPLSPEPTWQSQLADLVTDPDELLRLLELDAHALPLAEKALRGFPLRVPRPYLARMEKGNPRDPLLLQVLPVAQEDQLSPGFSDDPLGEEQVNTGAGLLHKYAGRVLLIATSSCAIHCRYCFRRHFPYADNRPGRAQWQGAFDYIAARPEIHEVILSGGDPLACSNNHLQWLLGALAKLPHVTRLRLHTRLPLMLPLRVDTPLQQMLHECGKQVVVVLHANHAREFDTEVDAACSRLRVAGAQLLNQSVLLRGVNDDTDSLCALSERLFAAGVLPYYLHLLDKVRGAAHFDVAEGRALALLATLQQQLPGYLVPRLVREESGQPSKTPVTAVKSADDGLQY